MPELNDGGPGTAALLRQAMAQHRQGRLEEADRDYAAFLDTAPRHAQALRLRGVLARERGDLAASSRLLRKAMQAAPDDAAPLNELAMTHMAAGELALAETAMRRAVARWPDDLKALANLGALLQYRGHIRQCLDLHRRALALDEGDVEVRCNLAKALVEAGRGEEALAECDAGLANAAGHPLLLATRGAVSCDLGRFDAAVAALEQALLRDPADDMALVNLAYAHQRRGECDAAIAALRRALAASPDNARATADLASALCAAGRAAEALALCERFLSHHPGERMVLAAYGHVLRDAGQEADARALSDYQGLVRIVDLDRPPADFASLAAFNAALATLIRMDPSLLPSPPSKATRGGSQTGELDMDQQPALSALRDLINAQIEATAKEFRQQGFAGHPVMAWASERWTLRAWGTVLESGGQQAPHIHPLGWLSGVYYVKVPPGMAASGPQSGWLEFGMPPEHLSVRPAAATRAVEPREGRLAIFPSYFHHRTLPFDCGGMRISIAFDAVPRRG